MYKELLNKVKNNGLLNASFWSVIATVFRVLSHIILSKLVAVYTGSGGLAILGQLRSLIMFLESIATGAIGGGVSKYLAEYKNTNKKQVALLSTSLSITLVFSLLTSLALGLFADEISEWIFGDTEFKEILLAFSFTLPFYAINMLLIATLYGLKAVQASAYVNISGSISSLLLVGTLTYHLGLKGAMLGNVFFQLIVLIITFYFTQRLFAIKQLRIQFDAYFIKKLFQFSLLAIVLNVTAFSDILIRKMLTDLISVEAAGNFEAILRLMLPFSLMTNMVVNSYYIPHLSSLHNTVAIQKEIKHAMLFLGSVMAILFVSLFLIKNWLIDLLFTDSFSIAKEILPFYLLGEWCRLLTWPITNYWVAKARIRLVIIVELVVTTCYLLSVYWLLGELGVMGIGIIHLTVFLVYMLILYHFFNKT
ncbi:O-antigen translocase [Limibacter armeniacum]|uniref:O-antigen translocase n=1 Tax=Limibacter armeniacum TaxID=466084 RepID=UPI002FE514A8